MNFLAHIYLSGTDPLLKIGNFIADRVRGKQYLTYESGIQKGILLHRNIDSFTDFHPIFRQSKKKLVPRYNHYAGVIVDVLYDHFLAKNWSEYSPIPLPVYAHDFYQILNRELETLPEAIQKLTPIMMHENWLVKYQTVEGIRYILTQMDSRTQYLSKMSFATEELELYYPEFETEFTAFFEEIRTYVLKLQSEKKMD